MAAEDKERIVARIRKLLAKLQSAASHETASDADKIEAAAAAEEARRIMEKHGITDEDVSDAVAVIVESVSDYYREEIAIAVAQLVGCKAFTNGSEISFRGFHERVSGGKTVYQSLVQSARPDVPAEVYIHLCGGPTSQRRVDFNLVQKAWAACWWPGYVAAVVRRLWRIREGEEEPVKSTSPRVGEAAQAMTAAMNALPMARGEARSQNEWFRVRGFDTGRADGDRVAIEVPVARETVPRVFGVLA